MLALRFPERHSCSEVRDIGDQTFPATPPIRGTDTLPSLPFSEKAYWEEGAGGLRELGRVLDLGENAWISVRAPLWGFLRELTCNAQPGAWSGRCHRQWWPLFSVRTCPLPQARGTP